MAALEKWWQKEECVCERASKPLCLHNPGKPLLDAASISEGDEVRGIFLPGCRNGFCSLSDNSANAGLPTGKPSLPHTSRSDDMESF